jgi:carbonic anhydrase
MVMLGHSGCGAVTGAVEAYMQPLRFWAKSTPPMLRLILNRLFVPVREAANGLKQVWGRNARNMPGYREALIESAVCMNVAQTAYDLRLEVERSGKFDIEVLFGVYNLFTHQVSTPVEIHQNLSGRPGGLVYAMSNPRDFDVLSCRLAERLLLTHGPKKPETVVSEPTSVAVPAAIPAATGGNGASTARKPRSSGKSNGKH